MTMNNKTLLHTRVYRNREGKYLSFHAGHEVVVSTLALHSTSHRTTVSDTSHIDIAILDHVILLTPSLRLAVEASTSVSSAHRAIL